MHTRIQISIFSIETKMYAIPHCATTQCVFKTHNEKVPMSCCCVSLMGTSSIQDGCPKNIFPRS